jgi:hypothetical protein
VVIELLQIFTAAVGGAAFASAFWTWKLSWRPSQFEMAHENVALTILASEALSRLDEAERRGLQADVNEAMVAAFGEDAAVKIERNHADA